MCTFQPTREQRQKVTTDRCSPGNDVHRGELRTPVGQHGRGLSIAVDAGSNSRAVTAEEDVHHRPGGGTFSRAPGRRSVR